MLKPAQLYKDKLRTEFSGAVMRTILRSEDTGILLRIMAGENAVIIGKSLD